MSTSAGGKEQGSTVQIDSEGWKRQILVQFLVSTFEMALHIITPAFRNLLSALPVVMSFAPVVRSKSKRSAEQAAASVALIVNGVDSSCAPLEQEITPLSDQQTTPLDDQQTKLHAHIGSLP